MLAELPPTPQPVSSPRREDPPVKLPKPSPKKSPVKPIVVGKAGAGRKAAKLSRQLHKAPIPAYETEVIPVLVHASSISIKPIGLGTSLLATSFQLPPPSPQTSLPTSPALPPSVPDLPSLPQPQLTGLLTVPETPLQRPFPIAKPLANRMVHAYSPAKPSPLSRVAVLAESLASLGSPEAGPSSSAALSLPLAESYEEMFPPVEPKQMSLAAELGVESSPEEDREKKVRQIKAAPSRKPTTATTTKGRKIHGNDTRTAPVVDKGKARVVTAPSTRGKVVAAVPEKENSKRPTMSSRVASTPAIVINAQPVKKASKPSTTTSNAPPSTTTTKIIPSAAKSGPPRRVLVDNPTAPPTKARKS